MQSPLVAGPEPASSNQDRTGDGPLKVPSWLVQVVRFLAVGVLNTLVDAGLYLALTRWMGLGELQALAKAISYGAGIVNSYYWNRTWTFRSQAGGLRRFAIFVTANVAALALNAGAMHVGLSVLGLPEAVAFMAAAGATFVWNFCASRFVVFREAASPSEQESSPQAGALVLAASLLIKEKGCNLAWPGASDPLRTEGGTTMSSLSIVLPAYNEEENVAAAVEEVSTVAQRLGVEYEIILVNDGSRDRTGKIGHELGQRIPNFRMVEHYPNRGYGGALKAGFAAATLDLIAFVPADKQFAFAEIDRFLARTAEADIVSGYRADRQDHAVRRLNAWGWNTLVRLLFGYLCRDIDCGFKVFRRELLDQVSIESDGAMIDTEFLAGAKARGFRIAEVPVTHLPRVGGEATGADLKVIARAFRDLVRFRLRLSRELRGEVAADAMPVEAGSK